MQSGNGEHSSALAAACYYGDLDAVKLLLGAGANPNLLLEHANSAAHSPQRAIEETSMQ